MRSFRTGVHPVRAGVIGLVLISIFTYFAFAKDLPFTPGYRVQAVFDNSNLVGQRTPVRIAGVDIGEVVAVERYRDTNLALVTMEIGDGGRPIHRDATIKVRPRLFLEGNFYLDLEPGTAAAAEIEDGGMIPAAQTSHPVQLHQVLTGLQHDTREALQETLKGLGTALDSEPTAADDADQDPDVSGLTGAQALNRTLDHSPAALRDSAIVNEALLGKAPRDLTRMIRGIARTSEGLARDEQALRDLVSDFNTTMATMASKAPELADTIRLLGPTASSMRAGFASLERALPATRAFSR
ncbi:MAG: MlaD family protein, partial [Thermoleophilaceae bacterium]